MDPIAGVGVFAAVAAGLVWLRIASNVAVRFVISDLGLVTGRAR